MWSLKVLSMSASKRSALLFCFVYSSKDIQNSKTLKYKVIRFNPPPFINVCLTSWIVHISLNIFNICICTCNLRTLLIKKMIRKRLQSFTAYPCVCLMWTPFEFLCSSCGSFLAISFSTRRERIVNYQYHSVFSERFLLSCLDLNNWRISSSKTTAFCSSLPWLLKKVLVSS